MPANSVIDLVSLDPDLNKQSLINYLRTQSRFKGYDFSGDDINIILDILGANYFRNAFLLNMAISEGFIDSAQLQNSIKSHAKELNYVPRSMTSAMANVTVSFTATGESQPYIIPKGSTFASSVKNQNFSFSLAEPIIVSSPNNQFSFTSNIFEGIYVKDTYFFDTTTGLPLTFQISNANVDTSSIVVNVFGNNSTIGQNYNLTTSLLDLSSNSYIYFLQCAAANGNYEILFGDGIFGHRPLNGSVVIIDYRITAGSKANGSGTFDINFDPTGANELTSSVDVVTNEPASGGAEAEDIKTTRFYAPRWFQVQERAIVPNDYEILLQQKFPEINAIHAYGGETLSPPQFGKVVICLDLANISGLPRTKIQQYTNFIKGRNPLSIQPIFVAAQHIFIQVNSLIKYNVNVSLESEATIKSIVTNTITEFNRQNLNDFDVTFYYSQLIDEINDADPSILSNETNIKIYQKCQPTNEAKNYIFNFAIPLKNDVSQLPNEHSTNIAKTVSSTSFIYKGNLSYLEDDGIGTLRIVNLSGSKLTTVANIGTVDYTTGIIKLQNFGVDSFSGNDLLVLAEPTSLDVTAKQNNIISIEPDQINLTVTTITVTDDRIRSNSP